MQDPSSQRWEGGWQSGVGCGAEAGTWLRRVWGGRCEQGRGWKRKTEKLPGLRITTATLAPRAKLLRIRHRKRMG